MSVRSAMAASRVGKRLPEALYVHISAVEHLPVELRRLVAEADALIPDDVPVDLVKLDVGGRAVSFLSYPGFLDEAHPALESSTRVDLDSGLVKTRDYSRSANPPILHRKETFLHPSHSRWREYAALTEVEEALGLLSSPRIGFRRQWEELLEERGVVLDGCNVVVAHSKGFENPARLYTEEVFYHGTPTKEKAYKIVAGGIQPGCHVDATALTPAEGVVYVTKDLAYAVIYALGGALLGYETPDNLVREYGRYGYVFAIPGDQIGVVDPDEDSIGEMIYNKEPPWLREIAEDVLQGVETAFPGDYYEGQGYLLLNLVDDGEYAAWAEAGKILIRHLSEDEVIDLIEAGAHIAHHGSLCPSEAWRIDRRRSQELSEDASNFFEIAERIN